MSATKLNLKNYKYSNTAGVTVLYAANNALKQSEYLALTVPLS